MSQHKYGAKPTVVDNIRFASQKEARRYQELKLLEKAGEIRALHLQRPFALRAPATTGPSPTVALGIYRADFVYIDCKTNGYVVEDVKGFRTPLYRWKKRHVEAQYGITILET